MEWGVECRSKGSRVLRWNYAKNPVEMDMGILKLRKLMNSILYAEEIVEIIIFINFFAVSWKQIFWNFNY